MSDPMIFQFIGDAINGAMKTYVESTVPETISDLASIAVALGAFYYSGLGMLMSLGRAEGSFAQLMISFGKFMLIGVIAMTSAGYMHWVVDTTHGLETGLTAAFSGAHGANPSSVYQVIDQAVNKGFGLGADLWERASNRGLTEMGTMIGEYLEAAIVFLATLAIAAPAGAMIVVAKTLLEILLGIGPFFIMMLMLPITKGFFDRWFAEIMTTIFQVALIAAMLGFSMKCFVYVVGSMNIDATNASPLYDCLRLLIITLVLLAAMYALYQKAASLGGGMAAAAITLGGMVARASGIGRAAHNVVNPTSQRRDLQSGMMTTGTRLDHLAAGNSMWNPRYRQAIMENLGKRWGHAEGGSVSSE